ncbi:hypothetical protein [Mesorhizobium kowhaii]|uniref:hypothetical protein n=1 Tax=Mesorhizobium kowhaii TaxID=1300272 RepID=UPI00142D35E1
MGARKLPIELRFNAKTGVCRDDEAGDDVVGYVFCNADVLPVVSRHLSVERGLLVELAGAAAPAESQRSADGIKARPRVASQ